MELIAIVDYGSGNLRSVQKAFEYIGSTPLVTSDPDVVSRASAVVLPGVGAFADAVGNLELSGLKNTVISSLNEGKPFLGICLGLQMLFDGSEETQDLNENCPGSVSGLGFFKGHIRRFPRDMGLKVPHMGWNKLDINFSINSSKPEFLFSGLPEEIYVYFVHSYYLKADERSIVAATANYGIDFDAAVVSGNVTATQFHPEKSGRVGLQILTNWVNNFARV